MMIFKNWLFVFWGRITDLFQIWNSVPVVQNMVNTRCLTIVLFWAKGGWRPE
jgi:hypothetical protein